MTETVHYNIAKLLAEKGFPQNNIDYETISTIGKDENDDFIFGSTYSCPTIAQVIMWLYEKHGIWISVNRVVLGSDEWGFSYSISYLPKEFQDAKRRCSHLEVKESFKESMGSYTGAWNSPTEVYIAAITHVLTSLNK